MERFEIQDNQFIKKNVISSLPKLPQIIDKLLNNWSSNQIGKSGKYEEKLDGSSVEPCGIDEHYLCQYYRTEINPQENQKQKTKNKKNVQAPQKNNYNYADLIVGFLNEGDVLYALTIANIILRVARKARSIADTDENKNILTKFISNLDDFRYKIEHDTDLIQNVQRDGQQDEQLENARKAINKELIYKIDGVTALTKEIGTDNFIKYAIDQCYFFAPEIAQKQMQEIVGAFEDNDYKKRELHARHSIKKSENYNGSNQDNVEDFDVEEKSTNNVSYHQTTDYYGTALAAAESAIKTYKGKSQDKENKIKNDLALAILAKEKIQDNDKQVKAKGEIKNAIEEILKSADNFSSVRFSPCL